MEPGSKPPGEGSDGDMDDILASIRRILHSDDAEATAALDPVSAPPPAAAGPGASDHVIDLHRSMRVDPESPYPPADEPARHEPAPAHRDEPGADESLLGAGPASESAASLASLREALAAQHAPAADAPTPVYRGGGLTIEDVVRDEVRELLRTWLDEHLPPMVERMVRAEIARISGST